MIGVGGPSELSSLPRSPRPPATSELLGDVVVFLNQSESVDAIPSGPDDGVLSIDKRGCLGMQSRAPGGPPFAPMWPLGYSLEAAGERPARILDAKGGP